MDDFILLKAFNISLHITRSHENSRFECGVIVRDNHGDLVLAFSEHLVAPPSFHVKCKAIIRAIQIASDISWAKLWIETNSLIVVQDLNPHWFLGN